MASIDKTNEIDALSRLAGKAPVASSDAQNEIDVDNEDLKEINNLLSKVDSGEIIDPGLEQVARSYKVYRIIQLEMNHLIFLMMMKKSRILIRL